jgi:hypothetical protein
MYKYVDFTQLEGFPFTQDTLKFLQESYREEFAAIAGFMGDNVIMSGVADLGADWGDGWVCIAGELLPFVGGTKAAQIVIEETTAAKVFGDGSSKDVWITRVAKSGVAGGTDHTSFVRLDTLKAMMANNWVTTARINDLAVTTAKIADASVTDTKVTSRVFARRSELAADFNDATQSTIEFATGAAANPPSAGGTKHFLVFNTIGSTNGSINQMAVQVAGTGIGNIYNRLFTAGFPGSWGGWTLINNP